MSTTTARLRSDTRHKRLLATAGIVCALAAVVATFAHVVQLRDTIQSAARGRLLTIARVLGKEVDRTLLQTRGLIDQVDDALRSADGRRQPALDALLEQLPRQQTLLREVAVVDRAGRVVASSNPRSVGLDVSGYDFSRADRDGRLHVGAPKAGRSFAADGRGAEGPTHARAGFLTLSRATDGDPDGLRVVAVLGTDSLIGDLQLVLSEPDSALTLYRYDGLPLATSEPDLERRTAPHPVFTTFLPKRESGGFDDVSGDGRAWLAHFDTSASFPIVVEVRLPQAMVNALWQRELTAPALILLLTLATVAAFTRAALRALRERVRSERQAATQERRLRNILESAADGIVTVDARGVIREYNRAAESLFGVPASVAVGRPLGELVRTEDGGAAHPAIARVLAAKPGEGAGRDRTFRAQRPDGQPLELSVAVSEVVDAGERLFTGIVRDVSERRRYEQQLREARDAAESAAAAKAQFLAMMSHELRTPMTGIIGMVDLLQDTGLSDEQRHFVGVLRGSAKSLLSVLDDVLDYSKIEAGRLRLEHIDFRPAAVAREVVDLLSHSASQRGNTLTLRWTDAAAPAVCGDPTRVRQLLFNLVGNAIKFTQRGRVTVVGGTQRLPDGRVELTCSVSDTGVGISPDVLPLLFQPFQQADGSTTRRFGGTGLGLAICRRLVEAMDGAISVDSTPQVGSTFRFVLRLDAARGDPLEAAPVDDTPAARGLRLLVAEDNPTNRLLIGTRLRRASHRVDVVVNGLEAVAAVRDGDYDVVLMDMQMPELDGVGATRAIRALPDARARVPIIALTADALPEFRERYMSSGLDDYLTKPIDWPTLDRVLRRYAPGGDASHRPATQAGGSIVAARSESAPVATPRGPVPAAERDGPVLAAAERDGPAPAATERAGPMPAAAERGGPEPATERGVPTPVPAAADPPPPADASGPADEPPDAAPVAAMREDLGDAIWQEVAHVYWPRAADDLDACRTAVAAGDAEARRAAAHSLKGASASVGFDSVAGAAGELERCEPAQADAALATLEAASAAVRAAWCDDALTLG